MNEIAQGGATRPVVVGMQCTTSIEIHRRARGCGAAADVYGISRQQTGRRYSSDRDGPNRTRQVRLSCSYLAM